MDTLLNCIPPGQDWITLGGRLLLAGVIALLGSYLVRRVLDAVKPLLTRNGNYWGKSLFNALHQPLIYIIWLHAAAYALDSALRFVGFLDPIDLIDKVQHAGSIALVTLVILRWKKGVEDHLKKELKARTHDALEKATIDSISRFVGILIYLVAILTILPALGASTTTILDLGKCWCIRCYSCSSNHHCKCLWRYCDSPHTSIRCGRLDCFSRQRNRGNSYRNWILPHLHSEL